jgi:hypothetical protein
MLGRNIATAIGSPVTLVADALEKTGIPVGPMSSRALQKSLTALGLPEAETGVEKFGQSLAQSAPAFALPASLPAQALGNAAISAAMAKPGEEMKEAAIGAAIPAVLSAPVANVLKRAVGGVLGMSTGAGETSIREAAAAGRAGGQRAETFRANMRGDVEPAAVVEQARRGVQNMRQTMYDNYANARGGWAGDTTPLNFTPINDAFDSAARRFSFNGVPQPGVADVLPQVRAVLDDWMQRGQNNPAFFTTEGLDSLKRHLQDLTPDFANRTGRSFVTDVVDSVRNTIINQRPQYADAMRDYWARSSQLDEIERSLSLGGRATIDTALRKLQSLTRNNVNTNYGQRVRSAQAIAQQGGENIMPAVAGQALSSPMPHGMQALAASGVGGTSLFNPTALFTLPLFSPRVVGEATHLAGRMVSPLDNAYVQAALSALKRGLPAVTREQQQ